MRIMPFMKRKSGIQFAGVGIDSGGGGDTSALANKTNLTDIILTGTTNTSGDVISAGTWFYLNGTPCVAKVDIASGATFTEGTNYEEKTVGSALSELNSKSSYKVGDVVTIPQILATGYYNTSTHEAAFVLPLSKVIDDSCTQISVHIGSINVIYNTTNRSVTASLDARDIEGKKLPCGLSCDCKFTDGISAVVNPTFLVACTISFM